MSSLYETLFNMGLKSYSAKTIGDGIIYYQASTHRDRHDNPVTEVWHPIATSIAFKVHMHEKKVHIQRTNSKQKGMGTRMVDAVVSHFPGYVYSVVDQSRRKGDTGPTFWDKMKAKHPKLSVAKVNNVKLPQLPIALAIRLSSITNINANKRRSTPTY